MMYVRSVSNLPAKTARFPREPALAATDLSARSATASATERMERRAAELVLEAGAAKAAAAEARWALTGARAEATTRVAEAETAKDIVVLLRVEVVGGGRALGCDRDAKSANLIQKLRGTGNCKGIRDVSARANSQICTPKHGISSSDCDA